MRFSAYIHSNVKEAKDRDDRQLGIVTHPGMPNADSAQTAGTSTLGSASTGHLFLSTPARLQANLHRNRREPGLSYRDRPVICKGLAPLQFQNF